MSKFPVRISIFLFKLRKSRLKNPSDSARGKTETISSFLSQSIGRQSDSLAGRTEHRKNGVKLLYLFLLWGCLLHGEVVVLALLLQSHFSHRYVFKKHHSSSFRGGRGPNRFAIQLCYCFFSRQSSTITTTTSETPVPYTYTNFQSKRPNVSKTQVLISFTQRSKQYIYD